MTFFDCSQSSPLQVQTHERESALVNAFTEILWNAHSKEAKVLLVDRPAAKEEDFLVFSFDNRKELASFFKENLRQVMK